MSAKFMIPSRLVSVIRESPQTFKSKRGLGSGTVCEIDKKDRLLRVADKQPHVATIVGAAFSRTDNEVV